MEGTRVLIILATAMIYNLCIYDVIPRTEATPANSNATPAGKAQCVNGLGDPCDNETGICTLSPRYPQPGHYQCRGYCGPPPNITNAAVLPYNATTDLFEGETIYVNCAEGYADPCGLVNASIVCTAYNTWSLACIDCRPICYNLTDNLPDGVIIADPMDTYVDGQNVSLVCEAPDWISLAGNMVGMCDNGNWILPEYLCVPNCGNVTTPDNAEDPEPGYGTSHGSFVSFECSAGYAGCPSSECVNGTWYDTGSCEQACSEADLMAALSNTDFTILNFAGPYIDGGKVAIGCKSGHVQTGDMDAVCNADGTWTLPTTNKCKDDCGDFGNTIANTGTAPPEVPTYEGSSIKVPCADGYSGCVVVTCEDDGTGLGWQQSGECKPDCGVPPSTMSMGDATLDTPITGTQQNDEAHYTCTATGEILTSVCQADGTWPNVICTEYCDTDGLPIQYDNVDGQTPQANVIVGGTADVTCATSYSVKGGCAEAKCITDENGDPIWDWNGECVKECSDAPETLDGADLVSDTETGTNQDNTAQYECPGSGETFIAKCKASGDWEAQGSCSTTCPETIAPAPTNAAAVTLDKPGVVGQEVTFTCNAGSSGCYSAKCSSSGLWEFTGECAKDCDAFPGIDDTTTLFETGKAVGDYISVTCDDTGARLDIECIEDPQGGDPVWDLSTATCPAGCDKADLDSEAAHTEATGYTSGTALHGYKHHFTCADGYSGSVVGECVVDAENVGDWDIAGTCDPDCGEAPGDLDGNTLVAGSATGTQAEDQAKYTCPSSGEEVTATCDSTTKNWAVEACTGHCGVPAVTDATLVDNSGELTGDLAVFTCDDEPSFSISGTCTGGSWTYNPSEGCPTFCSEEITASNAVTKTLDAKAVNGDQYVLNCANGYSVAGGCDHIVVTCDDSNGMWTSNDMCVPECDDPSTLVIDDATQVQHSGNSQGSALVYSCPGGNYLSLSCDNTGNWAGPTSCPTVCDLSTIMEDNVVSQTGHANIGDMVLLNCAMGTGSADCVFATCHSNGSFTVQGSCDTDCGDAPPLLDGAPYISKTGSLVGAIAYYDCPNSDERSEAQCLPNGTWVGTKACPTGGCGSPPAVTDAEYLCATNQSENGVATWKCDNGYNLQSTCLANGSWEQVSCPIGCGTNPDPKDGASYQGNTTHGTYTCDDGTVPEFADAGTTDQGTVECTNGAWSNSSLVCHPTNLKCGPQSGYDDWYYFKGHCYQFNTANKQFHTAIENCCAKNASLAMPNSTLEMSFYRILAATQPNSQCWMNNARWSASDNTYYTYFVITPNCQFGTGATANGAKVATSFTSAFSTNPGPLDLQCASYNPYKTGDIYLAQEHTACSDNNNQDNCKYVCEAPCAAQGVAACTAATP